MTLWQTLFGFNGRIGRMTFWLSALAVVLIDLSVVVLVSGWVHSAFLADGAPHRPDGSVVGVGLVLLLVAVISIWAALALKVKRCHDRGRSGWWIALALTGIGVLWLLYELGFRPGVQRRNRFGEAAGAAPMEPLPEVVSSPMPAAPAPAAASAASQPVPEPVLEAPVDKAAADEAHPPVNLPAVIEAPAPDEPAPDEPAAEPALEPHAAEPMIEPEPEPGPEIEQPRLDVDHAAPAAVSEVAEPVTESEPEPESGVQPTRLDTDQDAPAAAPEIAEATDPPHVEHPAWEPAPVHHGAQAEPVDAAPAPAVTAPPLPAAHEAH